MSYTFRPVPEQGREQARSAEWFLGHTRLPLPRASFLGREHELRTVRDLLRNDATVVTLTGPGGVGKTRLALQVATQLAADSPGGTIFVDLSPVRNPELVVPRIAQAIGISDTSNRDVMQMVIAILRFRQVLLILDTCEHVLAAVPQIAHLVDACPAMQILATSRAPLRMYGEHCVPVPPLPVPGSSDLLLATLLRNESVRLFVDRARAIVPGFAPNEDDIRAIAVICQRLDGLPLAIELAAARTPLFTPGALLGHLSHRLSLLVEGPRDRPARQRTLRDTIAWSYELLDAEEQALFRHLAVFVDGFDIEAASAVVHAPPASVLQQVGRLVEQSLLTRMEGAGSGQRFTLLETTRELALEQLRETNGAEKARRRHATHFLHFAEQKEEANYGPEMQLRLDQFEVEYPNCRAALQYFIDAGDVTSELWLAALLSEYWNFRGRISEGIEALRAAIDRANAAPPVALAKAMTELAFMYWACAEEEAALSMSEAAVPLARQGGDIFRLSQALFVRAMVLADTDASHKEVISLLEETVALEQDNQPLPTYPAALVDLGWAWVRAGHPEKGLPLVEQALEILHQSGLDFGLGWTLLRLGRLADQHGDVRLAAKHLADSLRAFRDAGMVTQIGYPLTELFNLLVANNNRDKAERLAGTIQELSQQTGANFQYDPVGPPVPGDVERPSGSSTIRHILVLPPMPLSEAINEAIAAADALATGRAPSRHATPARLHVAVELSAREQDVLSLLVQRYTAPEIADQLFISVRTVERHVANVYNKLGVSSRRAAAALALQHGLVEHHAS